MLRRRNALALMAFAILNLSYIAHAQSAPSQSYTVTEINIPAGFQGITRAKVLNNAGLVAGDADDYTDPRMNPCGGYQLQRPFIHSSGVSSILNISQLRLGSNTCPDQFETMGINNGGQVVGTYYNTDGEVMAYLYNNGVAHELNSLVTGSSGWYLRTAFAINDNGQIIGTGIPPGREYEVGYLFSNGTVTEITVPSGIRIVQPVAINNSGQVTVVFTVPALGCGGGCTFDDGHIGLWQNGTLVDFGQTNNGESTAVLNNSGVVAMSAMNPDGSKRAVIWQNGVVTELGSLYGRAYNLPRAINSFNQVVGESRDIYNAAPPVPFIWDSVSGMRDLTTLIPSNLGVTRAFAINDGGQILADGGSTGFTLLTPHQAATTTGSNVTTQSGGATLTFSNVTGAGTTVVEPDQTAAANYSLSNNLGSYEITTTATFDTTGYYDVAGNVADPTKGIKVAFSVASINDGAAFNQLVITHGEDANGDGVIEMVPYNGTADPLKVTHHDFTTRTVWVYVPHLSPFVIVKGEVGQLGDLIALVKTFNLRQGIYNSFDAKLQSAQRALEAAKGKDRATACNQVGAFVGEAQAQSGRALTAAQAQQLIAGAGGIRLLLGCK